MMKKSPMIVAVVSLFAVFLTAVLAVPPASSCSQEFEILTLSTRPDMVSGGNVLVQMEREASREITSGDLENFVRRAVQLSFGEVDLVPGELNRDEEKYRHEFREVYSREEWFLANSEAYRLKKIPPGAKRGEQRIKAVAGLIRAVVLKYQNKIYDLILTGDFHPRPHTILTELESALRDAPAEPDEIQSRIQKVYHRPGVEISGTTPEDFVAAVVGAVEKAS